ncbi:MAG: hypothetical protein HY820_02355 [Acidobacteria bacterium]|nr:hypothetical protein [Acidobacteriota bacterium]
MTIDYLVIGHITLDHFEGRVSLGGPALYSSLTARNLGARVALYSSYGDDAQVESLFQGIEVARVAASHSTAFRVDYDSAGNRTQRVIRRAAQLIPAPLPASRLVHLAPECHEIQEGLLSWDPGTLLYVTPQGWFRGIEDSGLIRQGYWAGPDLPWDRIDAMVLSDEDASAGQIAELAERVRMLVVTRAHHGADLHRHGHRPYRSPAFAPEREVDPTGAGDVYATAFFWRLALGYDPEVAADYANCVASFAVEAEGVKGIPTLHQVDHRYRQGIRARVVR